VTLGPAVLKGHILTFDIASFTKAFAKGISLPGSWRKGRGVKEPDHRQHRLLRARSKRPRRRTSNNFDELSPPHVRPKFGTRQLDLQISTTG
jgi:hypothetical protein